MEKIFCIKCAKNLWDYSVALCAYFVLLSVYWLMTKVGQFGHTRCSSISALPIESSKGVIEITPPRVNCNLREVF